MLRYPKWSYLQKRLFSVDHVSNQLPVNRTEADEEPALRQFSIDTETCSKCGGSTGRYQVRCDAAGIGCASGTQTTNHDGQLVAGSGYTLR